MPFRSLRLDDASVVLGLGQGGSKGGRYEDLYYTSCAGRKAPLSLTISIQFPWFYAVDRHVCFPSLVSGSVIHFHRHHLHTVCLNHEDGQPYILPLSARGTRLYNINSSL